MNQALSRIAVLDGIRAIAVLCVLAAHAGFEKIVPGGFGVTIFFFLSGYLITSLMRAENAETGTVSLRGFYLRRSLRILPPLWLTLLLSGGVILSGIYHPPLTAMLGPFGTQGPPTPAGIASQAFLVQNYAHLWGDPIGLAITGTWSLAIEEHYYLVFPLFYLLILRKLPQKTQVIVCLLLCLISLLFRIYYASTLSDYTINYVWTHTRLDSILFGACLALANNPVLDEASWRPRAWHAIAAIGVILLSLAIREPHFRETLRYTMQSAALYVLFSFALSRHDGLVVAALSGAPAKFVARYSYTLYLCHELFMLIALQWLRWWPAMVIALAISLLYAMAMYRWVEQPLARLRRRMSEPRSRQPTA